MPIAVHCDDCGTRFRVADRFAGSRIRCVQCKRPIEVGAETESRAESPAQPRRRNRRPSSPKRRKRKRTRKVAAPGKPLLIGGAIGLVVVIGLLSVAMNRAGHNPVPPIGNNPPDGSDRVAGRKFLPGDPPKRDASPVKLPPPTDVVWDAGKAVEMPEIGSVEWNVEAEAYRPPAADGFPDLLPLVREHGSVSAVMFGPSGTTTFVHKGNSKGSWIDIYNLKSRERIRSIDVPRASRLVHISRDETRIAMVTKPISKLGRRGDPDYVSICGVDDGAVIQHCRPVDKRKLSFQSQHVLFVELLDDDHALCGNRGCVAVWSISRRNVVWYSKDARLIPGGVSPDGRFVILQRFVSPTRGQVDPNAYVADALTGNWLGTLPLPTKDGKVIQPEAVCFHPDTTKLSAWTGRRVLTWDLANGDVVDDYSVSEPIDSGTFVFRRGQTDSSYSPLTWHFRAHGRYFLVANAYLIDPDLKDIAWQYLPPKELRIQHAIAGPAGRHWFCIGPDYHDRQFLVSVAVPSVMASERHSIVNRQRANMPAEDQFLREGVPVSLTVDLSNAPLLSSRAAEVESALRKRLEDEGLTIANKSDVRFVVKAVQSAGENQKPLRFQLENGSVQELEPIRFDCSRSAFVGNESTPRWVVEKEVNRFALGHLGLVVSGGGKMSGLNPRIYLKSNVNPATELRTRTCNSAVYHLSGSLPTRLYIGPPENAPPLVAGGVSVLGLQGEQPYDGD